MAEFGPVRSAHDPSKGSAHDDSDQAGFGWVRKVLGASLSYLADGGDLSSLPVETVLEPTLKLLLIYFSGRWCPICTQLDEYVKEVYHTLKAQAESGCDLELIWVSCDVTEASYRIHLEALGKSILSVPWTRTHMDSLSEHFDTQGIPALVVVDFISGKVLSRTGYEDVVDVRQLPHQTSQCQALHLKWMDLWYVAHGLPAKSQSRSGWSGGRRGSSGIRNADGHVSLRRGVHAVSKATSLFR